MKVYYHVCEADERQQPDGTFEVVGYNPIAGCETIGQARRMAESLSKTEGEVFYIKDPNVDEPLEQYFHLRKTA